MNKTTILSTPDEDFQYVHIMRPARLQYCDNDCKRPECHKAIDTETPLLCEAISREDLERAEIKWCAEGVDEILRPQEVYLLGLAFLVIAAEHENRKKYGGKELGEAIYAFLRATREDVSLEKRIAALLLSVIKTHEHFNLGDLETMFGRKITELLENFIPQEGENLEDDQYLMRLRASPSGKLAIHHYKAKLDWLHLTHADRVLGKKWRHCLTLLQ